MNYADYKEMAQSARDQMKISVRRWIRSEMLRSGIEHTADLAKNTDYN